MKSAFRLIFTMCLCFSSGTYISGQSGHITNDEEVRVVSDSAGIYSGHSNFNIDDLFTKKNWRGEWIWLNKSVFSEYQKTRTEWINNPEYSKQYRALFRKNLHLSKLPAKAIISITADVSYRLYINGNFVNQGPANIGSDYLDTVPPTHWLYCNLDVKRDFTINNKSYAKTPNRVKLEGGSYEILFRISGQENRKMYTMIHESPY